MVSSKFVQMIEDHSEQITGGVLHRLQRDYRTPHIARLPVSELHDQCQAILKNLGHWLAESRDDEVSRSFEDIGRLRAREGVPLHEAVHALHVLKERMLDYVRDQGIAQTSMDLYAEEELENQIGRLFDSVVYYVVKGYESAPRRAASAAVR